MLLMKYIGLKTEYEIEFSNLTKNIVQVKGDVPAKTHGFTLSRPGMEDNWDYSAFTTVYRELDGVIQFSNDGSVYVPPEPTPEPDPAPVGTADRQTAMDVANAYAVTTYGVETDESLTLDNSAYRFPAAVPTDATQATLEAKARDMVDFTFRQLMMQAGVDTLADAGFRCNVCIMEDGGSLLIYVLYDG